MVHIISSKVLRPVCLCENLGTLVIHILIALPLIYSSCFLLILIILIIVTSSLSFCLYFGYSDTILIILNYLEYPDTILIIMALSWSLWLYPDHPDFILIIVTLSWSSWLYLDHCDFILIMLTLSWSLWLYPDHADFILMIAAWEVDTVRTSWPQHLTWQARLGWQKIIQNI